jgi:hypothetical protein
MSNPTLCMRSSRAKSSNCACPIQWASTQRVRMAASTIPSPVGRAEACGRRQVIGAGRLIQDIFKPSRRAASVEDRPLGVLSQACYQDRSELLDLADRRRPSALREKLAQGTRQCAGPGLHAAGVFPRRGQSVRLESRWEASAGLLAASSTADANALKTDDPDLNPPS